MRLLQPAKIGLLSSALLLAACGSDNATEQQVPPTLVRTQTAEVIEHFPSTNFIGRIESYDDVTIHAQVSGYLISRHFEDGQLVSKGDVLYEIDPIRYQAAVAQARAAISQAKANLVNAELNWERGKSLLVTKAISQANFDGMTADKASAEAQVEAAKAQLRAAEVDLKNATIRAPFDGRIGRSQVVPGDLISPNAALTTLVSMDPIRASFNMSERERLRLKMDSADSASTSNEISLFLSDAQTYSEMGEVDFVGNRIDVQTGTLAMSARFANPDYRLLPGQYVELQLTALEAQSAVTIPRRAVQSDLEGEFVLSVNDEQTVVRHNVALGPVTEQGATILSGLEGGEAIIVSGLQRARPGANVTITEHIEQQ